jgi:hypothetical protein
MEGELSIENCLQKQFQFFLQLERSYFDAYGKNELFYKVPKIKKNK